MTEPTAVSLPGPAPGGTDTGAGSTPLGPAGPAPPRHGSRHLGAHHRPQHQNISTSNRKYFTQHQTEIISS